MMSGINAQAFGHKLKSPAGMLDNSCLALLCARTVNRPRQNDLEATPHSHFRAHFDSPTQQLDERLCNCEPEAGAMHIFRSRWSAVKLLKNPLRFVRRDADTLVFNHDFPVLRIYHLKRKADQPAWLAVAALSVFDRIR